MQGIKYHRISVVLVTQKEEPLINSVHGGSVCGVASGVMAYAIRLDFCRRGKNNI